MPTTVELCNAALLKLGAEPIATLDDASVEADFARRLCPFVRDGLMVAHPWSFTLATARLEADAEPPLAEFSHSFTLPGDHLRTLSAGVGQSARGLTYRIQGSKLLAGAQSI